MITYILTSALWLTVGALLGYMAGGKSDGPVKRTVEDMNADETLRAKVRKSDAEASTLRAQLIIIRNQGIASKSGTAQSMARKAKAVL